MANLGQLTRDILYFALLMRKQRFIPLKNCSKLVEGCLFAITDLLLGAKSFTFVLYMACEGMILTKNLKLKKNSLIFLTFNFFMIFFCSRDLKKQLEHSRLCILFEQSCSNFNQVNSFCIFS